MEKNKIRKPMTIARRDLISGVTGLINACGLPAFVVEGVLKDILREVSEISQKQLENDILMYNNMIMEQTQDEIQE